VPNDITVDETESATERQEVNLSPNTPDLNPLDYHVWNEFKQLV
jgi:hypothetical protein